MLKSNAMVLKDRGLWLSLWLILMVCGAIYSIYNGLQSFFAYNTIQAQLAYYREYNLPDWVLSLSKLPAWYFLSSAIVSVATFISGIALWKWKKWELYLYGAVWVVSILLSLAAVIPWWIPLLSLIFVGIFYLVLRGRWQYFE